MMILSSLTLHTKGKYIERLDSWFPGSEWSTTWSTKLVSITRRAKLTQTHPKLEDHFNCNTSWEIKFKFNHFKIKFHTK